MGKGVGSRAGRKRCQEPFRGGKGVRNHCCPTASSEENQLILLPFWHRFAVLAGEQGGEVAALE